MIIRYVMRHRNDAMYVYITIYVVRIRKSVFLNNSLRDLTATIYNVGPVTWMLRARTMHGNVHA